MAEEKTTIKLLHLPLKAKWYRMIESGEKTEEYREGFYWTKRLCRSKGDCDWGGYCAVSLCTKRGVPTDLTHVLFRYGYTKRTMLYAIDSITIGRGCPEWGAPEDRDVFIIKFHKEGTPIIKGK